MATATATASGAKKITEMIFEWEGRDKNGKIVRGEMRAGGEVPVPRSLAAARREPGELPPPRRRQPQPDMPALR